MNNSEIRKHLRKGELAVALAEALGYTFGADPEHPNREVWIAPVKPEDVLKDALEKLIEDRVKAVVKDETAKAYLAGEKAGLQGAAGPNWHIVKDMVGKLFRVRQENIPVNHPLRNYGSNHFMGVNFKAMSIQYERSPEYTGYTVSFEFKLRPFNPSVVRLPLSCAAFQ
ncbi:hypothetical protein Kurepalu2_00024 [Pseudomonas phage vB_PpuP-Kurepalu-2]